MSTRPFFKTYLLAFWCLFTATAYSFAKDEGKSAPKTPGETKKEAMAPSSQIQAKEEPATIRHFVPKAQQGLNPQDATVMFDIGTNPNVPSFDQERLTVKSGDIVSLTFRNESNTKSNNWVLVKPGKAQEVGVAGVRAGPQAGYIPVLPNTIIATTRMLKPGQSETIIFRAPKEPGRYPFISTFPGHWEAMNGVLVVETG